MEDGPELWLRDAPQTPGLWCPHTEQVWPDHIKEVQKGKSAPPADRSYQALAGSVL